MPDNPLVESPHLEERRSPLELLDDIPDSTLRRLKGRSGRLATEAVHAMEKRLPFFAGLEASQRASVQLVVQAAVVNFAEWIRNPASRSVTPHRPSNWYPRTSPAKSHWPRPSTWCG